MTEEIENKAYLKHLINAILQTKRVLVYRNEITGEIDDTYTFLYNYNDNDYDILTIPYISNQLSSDKDFITFLFETERYDINNLSNLIVDYIDHKNKNYGIRGYVYAELIRLMNMLNYKFSMDYTLFNKYSFSGKIRYHIMMDMEKIAVITESIEYCKHQLEDNPTLIGIRKCISYKLE